MEIPISSTLYLIKMEQKLQKDCKTLNKQNPELKKNVACPICSPDYRIQIEFQNRNVLPVTF